MHLLPGAAGAIGSLRRAGYLIVVVTNQSAIGRGYATRADVDRTNFEMNRQLAAGDADACIDLMLLCPHRPEDGCRCRKPLTGMFDSAPAEIRAAIDPAASFIVGDKWSDLEFGVRIGIAAPRCILVRTGHGANEAASCVISGAAIVPSLVEAAERILAG